LKSPKKARDFWIPTPSQSVLDDFKKVFAAHDFGCEKFILGMSPGAFVVLLKPVPNYEKVWGNLHFVGKWRFHQEFRDQQSKGEERFLEVGESWYNIEYVKTSARILGGTPYTYVWGNGDFQPLVLMSEKEEHCGAIGIVSYRCQPYTTALKLIEIAESIPLNAIDLSPKQIEALGKKLDIHLRSRLISPHLAKLKRTNETSIPVSYELSSQQDELIRKKWSKLTNSELTAIEKCVKQLHKRMLLAKK